MAIVKMKRLGLLAMREDREAILHALQGLGCVEISEPTLGPQGDEDAAPAEQLLASLSSPDTRALADAQARHHDAQRAMEVLRHDGAKGRGFLSPKPGAAGTSCMPRRQWHSRTRLLPTCWRQTGR